MRKIDMCNGSILKPMIVFAIPILLTGFLQQFFNAVDVILAGRLGTSGSDAVAAVGATTSITSLLVNFFIGCSTGSAVTVSHALGSGNSKEIKETVHTAMLLSFIIGAVLTVIGIVFSGMVLQWMGTPENIIGTSTAYLRAYFTGMIPYMVYYFGAAILRTLGETQKPFYFLLVSGPVKLVLTIVFVSVLGLDVVGLALATTCSQTVSAILVVISLMQRNDECKIKLSDLKLSAAPLKKILRLGIPSGIQSSTFSLSNVIIQSSANSLSYLGGFITGNAAACNIENFAGILTGVFYQCALNFTGRNFGAKKYDRVKKTCFITSGISTVSIVVFSAVVLVFARQILGIYIPDSKEAIEWGVVRLTFIFIPLIFQGLMDTMSGSLRGMGISISNTVINLLGICGFRIVWCLTIFKIPKYHSPQTLFLSYPITWIIVFVLQAVIFAVVFKKYRQKSEKVEEKVKVLQEIGSK